MSNSSMQVIFVQQYSAAADRSDVLAPNPLSNKDVPPHHFETRDVLLIACPTRVCLVAMPSLHSTALHGCHFSIAICHDISFHRRVSGPVIVTHSLNHGKKSMLF